MRKIYRLLEEDEYLQQDDEFWDHGESVWREVFPPSPDQILNSNQLVGLPYRRRETIEDEPKWEEVRDRTSMRVWAIPTISRHEDGSFHFLMAGAIQAHLATHYFKLPLFPQGDVDFETFWQTNKEKLIDVSKDAARLVYEKVREQ